MHHQVEAYLQEKQLLDPLAGVVIVGFSGGSDSVALLDILRRLDYDCVAAHCNFHLRSEESMRDEDFVRAFCQQHHIKLDVIDFQTVKYAELKQISIEMAARELRYNWFEELRLKYQAQAIATGHHLDDNMETFLLNFTRATGLKGLTGIPERNGYIVRPLLPFSQQQLRHYLQKRKLNFVVDSTNLETEYTRNKIRHIVIPALEEINPSIRKSFKNVLEHLQDAYSIYDREIHRIKSLICKQAKNTLSIDIQQLQTYPEKQSILFEIIKDYGFNSSHSEQIIHALEAESGKIFYTDKFVLLKDRAELLIRPILSSEKNKVETNQLKINIFDRDADFKFSTSNDIVHVDADKITLPIEIRAWQPADYFYPLGMKGKKKLSDFFIDLKINLYEKENALVALSEGKIVWVVGYRIDERFKVSADTKRVLELRV